MLNIHKTLQYHTNLHYIDCVRVNTSFGTLLGIPCRSAEECSICFAAKHLCCLMSEKTQKRKDTVSYTSMSLTSPHQMSHTHQTHLPHSTYHVSCLL